MPLATKSKSIAKPARMFPSSSEQPWYEPNRYMSQLKYKYYRRVTVVALGRHYPRRKLIKAIQGLQKRLGVDEQVAMMALGVLDTYQQMAQEQDWQLLLLAALLIVTKLHSPLPISLNSLASLCHHSPSDLAQQERKVLCCLEFSVPTQSLWECLALVRRSICRPHGMDARVQQCGNLLLRLAMADSRIVTCYHMLEVGVAIEYLLLKFEQHLGVMDEREVVGLMGELREGLGQEGMTLQVVTVLVVADRLLHLLQQ